MRKSFKIGTRVYSQTYWYAVIVSRIGWNYKIITEGLEPEVHVVSAGELVSASVRDEALKEAVSKD